MTFTFARARRRACALTAGAIVGALATVAPSAYADDDACAYQPPHATIHLGPAAYVESAGASYSTSACGRYIVNITAGASVGHFNFGGQLAASGLDQWTTVPAVSYLPAAACDQYSQALTVYQRSATGAYVEVGSARYRGELYFDSTYKLQCRLVRVPRSGTLAPIYGTHSHFGSSWRVAFSARFGADHQPVRVRAWPW